MAFETIHETWTETIMGVIKGGIDVADEYFSSRNSSKNIATASSLTKATKGLIMEFPVLISKANHIESAGIVAKAYEAKFVTLLQMAFSAANLTNSKDALDYLRNFHTNLNYDKISVDDFINVMDNIVQHNSTNLSADQYNQYKAITEDMKNLSYYFEDDIKESSLESFKVMDNYGRLKVVKEMGPNFGDPIGKIADEERANRKQDNDDTRTQNDTFRTKSQIKRNRTQNKNDEELLTLKKDQDARDAEKLAMDRTKYERELLPTNLISTDVRKANELVPTMLVINFVIDQGEGTQPITQNVIIGVKAKLYEVEPTDVINKIITKNVDSNILLKLVKLSTREISFAKDFLFAIDDAKLDALSRSRRGSSSQLFKVLERRAMNGKIRKMLKTNNYAKAISSLVISQEEAEELLKNNIDANDPRVIRPIMEKLNLISFAIIDESSESVRFIWDSGDDVYETIPLSRLEKEQKDGMSKKVINLLAKMNR